ERSASALPLTCRAIPVNIDKKYSIEEGDMKKGISMLLFLCCIIVFLSGCYVYGPPPTGSVGPAPGYNQPIESQEPSYSSPPSSGEVGPAPSRDHAPYDYAPPPPSGAVGPARYR
ncbi:MAG: hypothetical protein WA610_05190, partial [Thermodesulfovibrionales bacterium]